MTIGLHSGAYRLHAIERLQNTVAANLANLSTPGYQPEVTFIDAQEAGTNPTSGSAPQAFLPVSTSARIEVRSAPMRPTGNSYDFAVQGDGYFTLQDAQGRLHYSRDGEFHRNSEGVLVNKNGLTVMSDKGPIEIPHDDFSVARDGTLTFEGQMLSRLMVTSFARPEGLQSRGGGLFVDPVGQAGATPMEDAVVLQGYLEGSHVSPMREMVTLIDAARAYELSQKMIEEADQRAQKAIRAYTD